ncbi:mannonate dehydratase [Flavihumibacter profundi]|uniref:mannonate dehydratase n=1 Tax=Flavihumibacter profundi TaxID=2716883 RepID=UPI001CC60D5A|nr:mannonate dehydratase [Flavihumibacter profundi]MBZ5855989.1 mannonate dehydratase [Flavihumibacter profundi]
MPDKYYMQQSMRWYGPDDTVSLSDIRQSGCEAVVTALHHIPIGEVWPKNDIIERKDLIEAAGMRWTVIESLPVHDEIKKKSGDYSNWISNYKESLRNVAACGLEVVTYNFMPVLDWLRTDISYSMPDGGKALYFNRIDFIVFDLFLLQRPDAAKDYTMTEIAAARVRFEQMDTSKRTQLFDNCMLGLPGSKIPFTREQILEALQSYHHINATKLKQHLFEFLREIIPVAEEHGLKMAIHPDDPPYSILGLPRIMSTAKDVADLVAAVPSTSNGLCFCTGSYGARADNDLVAMLHQHADRVHFLHLRNTARDNAGNFYEADHLGGDTDMFDIMSEVWKIMQQRKISIPMRPDHGHQILDDLNKTTYPGYSAIGRLKGLAELRGMEYAISKS